MKLFFYIFGIMLILSQFLFIMIGGIVLQLLSLRETDSDAFPEHKAEEWVNRHPKLFRFLTRIGLVFIAIYGFLEAGWPGFFMLPAGLVGTSWILVKVLKAYEKHPIDDRKGRKMKPCYHDEHIDFRSGYWKLNVYLDGELIHSFDDSCGDIWAALKCRSCDEGSEFVDELIDEVQQSLVCSGKRELTVDEIEALKRKMLDIENIKDENEHGEKSC